MTHPSIRGVTTLLEIFDMSSSLAFYQTLGCEVAAHWGEGENVSEWDWVLLKLGDATLMLNTAYERDKRPTIPDSRRVMAHADTELFFECANLDSLCDYLRSKGVVVSEPETTFYGTLRVCLKDPDGFLIWFHAPNNSEVLSGT